MKLTNHGVLIRSFFIVVSVLIVDQVLKQIVLVQLGPADVYPVVAGWLVFHRTINSGFGFIVDALGISAGAVLGIHAGLVILVCEALIKSAIKRDGASQLHFVSLAMLAGGGLSNLLDRALWGGVLDWIEMPGFAAWNIADMAVWVGIVLLLFDVWWYNAAYYRTRLAALPICRQKSTPPLSSGSMLDE